MKGSAIKVLGLLLCVAVYSTSAFESYFKARVHKDLIVNIFQKNLNTLLSETNKRTVTKNVYVPELKAKVS